MPSTATKAARMSKKDMEKYRRLLEEKKASLSAELAKTRSAEEETTRRVHPGHRRQGGLLVHPRVPLLADRRRALDAAPDRRRHRPHRRRHLRPLHQLRPADGREAPERRALGARTASTARSSPRRACSRTNAPARFLCSHGPPPVSPAGAFFWVGVRLAGRCRRRVSPRRTFPKFADAPSAILVDRRRRVLRRGGGRPRRGRRSPARTPRSSGSRTTPPSESVSDALLNRSLFSPRRIVELDISRAARHRGAGAAGRPRRSRPGKGGAGGRREAFKHARALLAALDLPLDGGPGRERRRPRRSRVRKKDDAPLLAEILKELPEEKSGGPAVLQARAAGPSRARNENDGTVALLTAVAPPAGVDLSRRSRSAAWCSRRPSATTPEPALRRLAATRAKEREVALDSGGDRAAPDAHGRDAAATFAAELEKLLEWAGKGGRIRAADVEANVEDESSEDVYGLFDAIGRRDAGDALARLERLFDGRDVRAGRPARSTRSRRSGRSSSSACSPARSGGCCSSGRGSTKAGPTGLRRGRCPTRRSRPGSFRA